MKNLESQPRKLFLVLILIGTSILAIPAAIGTFALFDNSPMSANIKEYPRTFLLCLSIGGFLLFTGYILTAIFRRYYSIFWLISMIYNVGLSCCYIFLFLADAEISPASIYDAFYDAVAKMYILFPAWTMFVAVASGYYFKFALRPRKADLL